MPLLDATGPIADRFADTPPVEVDTAATIDQLRPQIEGAALIAIRFLRFGDGRGFSLAKQLREAGYRGRLRATGNLIPDQFGFALDCGFDEVEVDETRADRQPIEQWLDAVTRIGESYQPGRRASIFEKRRQRREPA